MRAALCSFNFYSVLLSVALINICLNLMIVACRRVLTSLCCAVLWCLLDSSLRVSCAFYVYMCVCTIILREQIFFTVCAPQHPTTTTNSRTNLMNKKEMFPRTNTCCSVALLLRARGCLVGEQLLARARRRR